MGRRDDSHIDPDRRLTTHAIKLTFGKHSQQSVERDKDQVKMKDQVEAKEPAVCSDNVGLNIMVGSGDVVVPTDPPKEFAPGASQAQPEEEVP